MRCAITGLGCALAVMLLSGAAAADDKQMWWLPVGMNLGSAFHPGLSAPTGFFIGAEASLAYVHQEGRWISMPTEWYGGYLDGVYDVGNQRGRFSIGPEIGYMFGGIDGGPVLQVGGGEVNVGGQFRLLATLGFLSIYGRQGFVPGDELVSRYTELGVLLKYPFPLE